ncbi:MAG TPA: TAT-variant-translocated molybdopterin oxidoreductase [Flavipsychrobacter sp.]|nr:TAT-variant-translocated molybdopterin oxidoreductase [Flavipsychrobacter sp.]
MSQKQYWKGLDELHNSAAHQETVENEFKEELPFDLSEKMFSATTPRRDFLKFLGFSTLAATIVSSCEMPVRKAIPYAIKPEDIVPGVPNYYASTFVDGGDYCAVVIKTRDGRPIKIEGNELSSITKGGTSARVQASVLNLYDKARLRQPYAEGQEATYEAIDRSVKEALGASNKTAYLLTGTILSPTVKDVINQFLAKYPNAKHIVYDNISYSGMLLANEASYGKRTLPTYHFDKAQTIVSIGADFLGTWLSPIEFAKGYSKGRKMSAENLHLSKHYQVEPTLSISGANADERATCKPSEMGTVAVALYNAIVNGAQPSFTSKKLNALITQAAADLKKGNGLVVCGSNDVSVQTVINAINDKIGANGTTVNWAVTSNYKQGIDSDMYALVDAMNNGQVGALMIHGLNPVYDYYDSKKFVAGLSKVPVTVSFTDRMDETAQKCKFIVPDHHYLESWGDAEPKPNYFSLMQPGIAPLFKTRAFADSLLAWTGATTTYGDYWKQYWETKLGSQENFDQTLQNGILEPAGEMANGGASFTGNVADAVAKIQAKKPGSGIELALYQKISIGYGGSWSNNPWLQEMPDPITKVTWDNYVVVSPYRAGLLDADYTDHNEVDYKKRVARIKVDGHDDLELPIVVIPGVHNDVIAVAVGYGRDPKVGRAAANTGKNAYSYVAYNGQTFDYSNNATIEKTDNFYDIACTQQHHSYEARPVIHEFTLEEFSDDPKVLLKERQAEVGEFAEVPWAIEGEDVKARHEAEATGKVLTEKKNVEATSGLTAAGAADINSNMDEGYRQNGTLYPNYVSPGIHWGMSVDLNSCIGCGACVIGCQAENNVSVVGKDHVIKNHEMHWMRIDRYFSGMPEDPDSIQTVFQPMLCQHCDNAPCENVCPVSATNHSDEGLNQMAYNRCIGTKYCANNCPYKVRRFNWMDWNGADCFEDNQYEDYRRDDLNDDLTRMVLNPDVTVRSRGVMEKCTFCVQRLQDAKLAAKKLGRPMKDGEARTACQQACPTDAILFGDVNDTNSAIYKLRKQQQRERIFYTLEHLHTLPNVNYLAKIRNTDVVVAGDPKLDDIYNEHI